MLSRLVSLCILLASLVWTAVSPAGATVYYLAPTGNDADAGTSTRPWRTLNKAAASMLPGDTVMIADGDYSGGIQHRVSGTAALPITYKAVNPGGPVIWGDRTTNTESIWIYRSHNIVIDGLTIRNSNTYGIRIDNSNSVTVTRCKVLSSGVTGIFSAYSDDTALLQNECAYSVEQHGIYLSNGGDRPTVRGNICHDNGRAGIQLNGDGKFVNVSLGTRGDGIIEDAEINGNVLYSNGQNLVAAALNLASVRTALISNNLLYNNLAGGIAMWNDNSPTATQWGCKDNRILNNTIYFRPGEGRWCVSIKHGSTGNTFLNNIFYGGHRGAFELDLSSPISADYNFIPSASTIGVATVVDTATFYSFDAWKVYSGNDAHSSTADPLFVRATSEPYDFHLAAGSPASASGAFVSDVPTDIIGVPRPIENPDPGSFEDPPVVATFKVSGKVTYGGVGIRRAKVIAGGKTVTTGRDGSYEITGLRSGSYTIIATHRRFTISPSSVAVTLGPNRLVNFTASSGAVSLSFSPDKLTGGATSIAKIDIGRDAPPEGLLVEIESSIEAAAVPETVTIPHGERSAKFTVTTVPVRSSKSGIIAASVGESRQTRSFIVTPPGIAQVKLSPNTINGGNSAIGTVKLSGKSPDGGTTVSLSTNSTFITVPTTVFVAEGASEVLFTVQSTPVAADGTATIIATTGSSSATSTIKVTAPTLQGIGLNPSQILGNLSSEATITLTGNASELGVQVALSARLNSGVSVPSTVVVPAGARSLTVPVQTTPVDNDNSVQITVTLGKQTKNASLKVLAPSAASLSIDPGEVSGGASATATVTINGPAGPGGTAVQIKSSNQSLVWGPTRIVIPAGQTSGTFALATKKPLSATTVTITATANKEQRTAKLKVN